MQVGRQHTVQGSWADVSNLDVPGAVGLVEASKVLAEKWSLGGRKKLRDIWAVIIFT